MPADYIRKGDDVELFEGDWALEGEERSHKRPRGWDYWIHRCVNGKIVEIDVANKGVKAFLRARGERELLRGSGGVAAMVRLIHAVRLGYEPELA